MTTSTVRAGTAAHGPELRPLTWALFALPALVVGGVGLVLVSGIVQAGSYATVVRTPIDPKEVIPFGPHGWNPFAWLYGATVLAVALSWPVGGLLALIGMGNLARPAVRAQRRVWLPLLAGVLCTLLLIALLFAPVTDELLGWWAD